MVLTKFHVGAQPITMKNPLASLKIGRRLKDILIIASKGWADLFHDIQYQFCEQFVRNFVKVIVNPSVDVS